LGFCCAASPYVSAPELAVTALDFQTLNITVFLALESTLNCVTHYIILSSRKRTVFFSDIVAEYDGSGRPVTVTASGFDLCNILNFTAFAVTVAGPGVRSEAVTYGKRTIMCCLFVYPSLC